MYIPIFVYTYIHIYIYINIYIYIYMYIYIYIKGTPWADGSSGVNSCTFDNGKSHTYIFDTMDSGSFWYHPHSYSPGMY
jgi:hypothetical protein